MNPLDDTRLVRTACRLVIFLAAGAALLLAVKPVTGAAPVMSASAADQVQPARRLKRLGQLYEELQKLFTEHHTAASTLKDIEKARNAATASQTRATVQLQEVLLEEQKLAPVRDFSPRFPGLVAQEAALRQTIASAQRSLDNLQPRWFAAKQRMTQLSQAVQSDLPKKQEEWLWLCDPLGKLGAKVHRESVVLFSQQITEDHEFALSYLGRGFDYLHTKQHAKALDDFAKVAVLDKEMANVAAAGRGWTYARMQRNSQAAAEFHKAIELKPTSPFIEMVLGHAYVEKQRDNFAENHFRKAVDLANHLPQAHDALAFFLATRRQDDPISAKQAIQHATKTCEMTNWDQWVYLETLAISCAAAGDFGLAAEWTKKSLDRAPSEYRDALRKRLTLYEPNKSAADANLHGQPGAPTPTSETTAVRAKYLRELRVLLDKGLGSGSHDLKAAKLHFDAAQRLSIADPRLHYAWGLVCLKHSRDDDAIREFRLAARSSPSSYSSAWPVLVRTHAARKDYTSACQALIDWARTVDEPKVDGSDAQSKNDDATQVGQTMGHLQLLRETASATTDSLAKCDGTILALLTGSRRKAYEAGKQQVQREYKDSVRPADELDDKARGSRKDGVTSRTAPAKFRGEEEKLRTDSKEAGKTIEQTAAQFEDRLNDLATQYGNLAARSLELDQSLTVFQNRYAQATDPHIIKNAQMAAEILRLHNEIVTLKKEREFRGHQMESIIKPAKILLRKYYLFLAQSHLSQQEIARRSKHLQDWEKRIAWRDGTIGKLPDQEIKPERQVDHAQQTLEKHFPLDFEMEKNHILASFSETADRSITNPPAR